MEITYSSSTTWVCRVLVRLGTLATALGFTACGSTIDKLDALPQVPSTMMDSGEHLLVDAGGAWGDYDPGASIVVPALRRMGVKRLEAAVVTHFHQDHWGGMPAVLEVLDVDGLWVPVPMR